MQRLGHFSQIFLQSTLKSISGINDVQRLDRELDFLSALGLIGGFVTGGGFETRSTNAKISPTALALQLYVRGQGYVGSPIDYFKTKEADPIEMAKKK